MRALTGVLILTAVIATASSITMDTAAEIDQLKAALTGTSQPGHILDSQNPDLTNGDWRQTTKVERINGKDFVTLRLFKNSRNQRQNEQVQPSGVPNWLMPYLMMKMMM
nr:putative lineage-restricted protein [Crepidula fornicata]